MKVLLSIKENQPTQKQKCYEGKPYLLTKSENEFLKKLEVEFPQYRFFAQIRLADIMKVSKNIDRRNFYTHFNKISSKSVDFLACDKETNKIAFAVELDDPTHMKKDRQARDIFVNNAFEQAGIKLIRVSFKKDVDEIDVNDIKNQLNQ
jgi:hypothetical protein